MGLYRLLTITKEALINYYNLVIASAAWQSHDWESVTWRLLRHFVPRNDALPGIRIAGQYAAVEQWLESRYHSAP